MFKHIILKPIKRKALLYDPAKTNETKIFTNCEFFASFIIVCQTAQRTQKD